MSLGRAVGASCRRGAGAGVRAWKPGTVPLACVPCRVSGAAGLAGCCSGEGLLTVVRVVWCQALSVPVLLPVLGAGSRAPLPVSAGHGCCGCRDPAAAPRRALLRAGVARCGLSLPLLPILGARSRRRPPTCCGRGCVGVGTQHWPFGVSALWGATCRGGGGRFSPGGEPLTVVGSVWCEALSLSRLPVLGAGGWAPLPPLVGRGCAGVGTRHCPLCVLALRGIARRGGGGRLPRGGTSHHCEERLVSGALSLPAACPCGQ